MPGYRSIGPAGGETIIGGTVGVDTYLDKGRQIDLEMQNLDSVVNRANQLAPDPAELLTWQAQKAAWDKYFQANIASPPMMPWQSDSDLNTWLDRIAQWKLTAATWAARGNDPGFAKLAASLPMSEASGTRVEDLAKPSVFANPYVKLGIIGATFLGLGWIASSVAKVVRAV